MNGFENLDGSTPLNPDEMEGLRLHHITTRGELNRFEQDNINEALFWIEKRRKKDILTEEFIKKLHFKMFCRVWKWAGFFRKSGKNIGVDWHKISSELHILLEDTRFWIKNKTFSDDEIAVRFHHRLVWIHLFSNGNGRHARFMTDLLMKEVLKQKEFTWDIKSLKNKNEVRNRYLDALRHADNHDYSALLDFVQAGGRR